MLIAKAETKGLSRCSIVSAFTTHNDTRRHWAGNHFDDGWQASVLPRARAGRAEFRASNGSYVDVHAWQFTPQSLRELMAELAAMKLAQLDLARAYDTVLDRNEFTAIFRKL